MALQQGDFTTIFLTTSRKSNKLQTYKSHNSLISDLPSTWATVGKTYYGHAHTPIPTAHYAKIMIEIHGHDYSLYATMYFLHASNHKTQCQCPPTHQPIKIKCTHIHLILINIGNQHGNHQDNTIV